jgi:hypothetical protein
MDTPDARYPAPGYLSHSVVPGSPPAPPAAVLVSLPCPPPRRPSAIHLKRTRLVSHRSSAGDRAAVRALMASALPRIMPIDSLQPSRVSGRSGPDLTAQGYFSILTPILRHSL